MPTPIYFYDTILIMSYPKSIKIGNIMIKSPIIMAPMAGITCLPYRQLSRQFGAQFCFAEMICANSIIYNNPKGSQMLSTGDDDRPLGLQILTAVKDDIAKALDKIPQVKYDILDLNAACPQKKVTSKYRGAALLNEPKKLKGLLKACVDYADVPVTVKLRLGWDNADHAVDVAKMCQDCGISAIFLHGRTRMQMYHGQVNYEEIAKVKKALTIPLIASGDIFSGPLAKKMFDETNCDGLLLARGAMANPWVIREIEEYLKSGKIITRPTYAQVADLMRCHFRMYLDFFGEIGALVNFRKFFAWYTKGFPGARALRDQGMRTVRAEDLWKIIAEIEKNFHQD